MYRLSGVLLAFAIVAGNALPVLADNTAPAAPRQLGALAPSLQGKPLVVRIHADWCPACKATQSTIDQLQQAYGSKVSFVQFDVTDAKTAAAAITRAKSLRLEPFLNAYKTATSTVGIIDPKNGTVVATFYNDSTAGDYTKAIDRVARELTTK